MGVWLSIAEANLTFAKRTTERRETRVLEKVMVIEARVEGMISVYRLMMQEVVSTHHIEGKVIDTNQADRRSS